MLRLGDTVLKHQVIKRLWDKLSPYPGGRVAFSKMLGLLAPYSLSIDAKVMDLGPGRARVEMRERWRLQNPFNSVHAIALANLGELTSGLAMMYGLPPELRAIMLKIEIEYTKKARGMITAVCQTDPIEESTQGAIRLLTNLRDEAGDKVATVQATWLVRPRAPANLGQSTSG